jgi:hypothetical protein
MVESFDDLDEEYQELLDQDEKQQMKPSFDQLDLNELFPEEFMREHTDYTSLEEFLEPTDFSASDIRKSILERRTNDEIDRYTHEHTDFPDWMTFVEEALGNMGPGAITL